MRFVRLYNEHTVALYVLHSLLQAKMPHETHSVLKEVWIQILVEPILIFNVTLLPIDLITKRYTRALHQLHPVIAG